MSSPHGGEKAKPLGPDSPGGGRAATVSAARRGLPTPTPTLTPPLEEGGADRPRCVCAGERPGPGPGPEAEAPEFVVNAGPLLRSAPLIPPALVVGTAGIGSACHVVVGEGDTR